MQEVAEHAFALLLGLARKVVALDRAARGGDWNWRPVAGDVHTIAGRTLGVVGIGRIGRRVADMGQAFGLSVCAHDPFVSGPAAYPLVPLDDVLAQSDFVSLHVPLSAATRHVIGARELGLLRPGACLINTARGGLIDERALLDALRAGRLGGAALDVREQEPPGLPDPLAELPNVILTPHVGAYSIEAGERLHEYGSRIAVELCN
jgi:phosphoglycerate dehydrogenase-like enzyme